MKNLWALLVLLVVGPKFFMEMMHRRIILALLKLEYVNATFMVLIPIFITQIVDFNINHTNE